MANGPDIVFDNVSFAYAPGMPALEDVTLTIPAGQFVAVLGANGSGKSTLAKHVNALLVPATGSVHVGGADTADRSALRNIRQRVGMVFQNPDNQSVASVVEDDVAFGPENLGLPSDEIRRRVDEALDSVGMLAHARDEISSLSGGQKQLVAIAGALALHPDILVLDEPGAMLDVHGRRTVLEVARSLNRQGMTVVLVTHFMEEAVHAQRAVVLERGRVALDGAPASVFADAARLRGLGLEPPFEAQLAEALETLREARRPPEAAAPAAREDSSAPPHAAGQPDSVPIVFDDVSFSYGDAPVLEGVTFTVEQGDFVGLIGHTGSGKSTLSQLMNALVTPSRGTVRSAGYDTAEKSTRRKIREAVGLVFQYPEQQLFAPTVAEDVAFGPDNLGLGKAEVEERSRAALEQVGLSFEEFAQRSPFGLSGGQKRRVAIAGVLAMEPQVLVLDEPAAGMDPAANRMIKTYLRQLNAKGMTIVLISHSMEDIAELCNKVVCLQDGHVLFQGPPAEVFSAANAPALRGIGLDLPRPTAYALEHGVPGNVLTVADLAASMLAAHMSPTE